MNRKQRGAAAKLGQTSNYPPGGTAAAMIPAGAADLLAAGLKLHQAGRLAEAEVWYRRVLAAQPDHADALHLLGVVAHQVGRHDLAVELIRQAIQRNGRDPDYFSNLGIVFYGQGKLDEAVAAYRQAINIKPDFAEAHSNLGNALKEQGKLDEAVAACRQAISIKPDFAEAHSNLGNALKEQGKLDEAVAAYRQAISIKPDYAETHFNLGVALTHFNLGVALKEQGKLDEAMAAYRRAINIKPDYVEALNNCGSVLRDLKRFEDALANYDKALAIKPDYADALNNRGITLQDLKRFEDALASYDKALAIKPDYAEALNNRGMALMELGRYREGWADYEWRWAMKDFPSRRPKINAPAWQGQDLTGRHLVVYAEQGLGDIIQFVRYLPLLMERKGKVTFFTRAKLARLLRPLVAQFEVVSKLGSKDVFDFQCALMSLPRWFNTDLSSIPNKVPYLRAEENLSASWKERIGEDGYKIGIAWQGNPRAKVDQGRSIPLEEFVPLTRVPSARLISLQKHHGLDQLARLLPDVKIETPNHDYFDDKPDEFLDTAAVMENLDLVITSDTSVAHLAGALGRPTWVALKYVPDWRWMLDRDDSPWYPTMRLFRQQDRDDWKAVFRTMENELTLLLSRQSPSRT